MDNPMEKIVDAVDLTISESICTPLWQVTAWPGRESAVAGALSAQPGPGEVRNGVARMGPLNWVVFEGNDAPDIAAENGTMLDISHARKRYRIEGDKARDVMMRLAPLDFRDTGFADQTIKATTSHHMSVWIERDGAAWNLYVGYTFADAMREGLQETAAQWDEITAS